VNGPDQADREPETQEGVQASRPYHDTGPQRGSAALTS